MKSLHERLDQCVTEIHVGGEAIKDITNETNRLSVAQVKKIRQWLTWIEANCKAYEKLNNTNARKP